MSGRASKASPPHRRRAQLEGLLIVGVALLFGWAVTWPLSYAKATASRPQGMEEVADHSVAPSWLLPFDDAYIFVRYAQQLSRGHPLEWSSGEPSTGSSSFLYPLLLLPGQWIADSVAGWSWWSRGVGGAGLALLGLAAAGWMRRVPLADPWPLAGGLALVLSGPIGLVALAGMEGAWNAAALVLTCALWPGASGEQGDESVWPWLALVSMLPLIRPENAVVTGVLSVGILAGGVRSVPRWGGGLVLAPGLALAALDWFVTGMLEPSGAVVKSWTATPFLDLPGLWRFWSAGFSRTIVRVYGGLQPPVLWPPIGLAAVGTAFLALAGRATRRLPQVPGALFGSALVWACLVVVGPLSSHLEWQWMRHHHSGLALAWLLGLAGMALAVERWAPRLRRLCLLIPLLLVLAMPRWVSEYTRLAWSLSLRHGAVVEWLEKQGDKQVLLLNDAGWLSLAHDGPAVDAMGLGTSTLARPGRHGAGSLVEALARYRLRPRWAAVNLENFDLPELLGERLLPEREGATVLARVRSELLDRTALEGPGLDFGYLPDEKRWRARWVPSLLWTSPRSIALALVGGDGERTLQGCRPVPGALSVALSGAAVVVVATALDGAGSTLSIRRGSRDRASGRPLASARLPFGRWTRVDVPPTSADALWLEAAPGEVPCVESIQRRSVTE